MSLQPSVDVAGAAAGTSASGTSTSTSVAAALPALLADLIALGAGALLACAFAPLSLWPLAILCPALQMWLWHGASPRRAARTGFWFGVGTFGVGIWWLYISIRGFGGSPIWLALFLVLALVGIMALYQGLLGYLAARVLPADGAARYLIGLPALWLLMEWWRGWFLSGFPWLSLGYSQTDTVLAGFAPVAGVYGVSAVLLLLAGSLVALLRGPRRVRGWALALLVLPWPAGALLDRIQWTHPVGAPVSVAVLQGAIPQDLKWQAANAGPTRARYLQLENQALGARLIVWPEAALPQLANEVPQYLGDIYSRARMHGSDVIMGVLRVDESDRFYNSIMTLAAGVSFYDKHHLVPFAEYFPVPHFVRAWLRLMSLPYSDFTPGPAVQPVISAGGTRLAPGICYEDAYGTENLPALRQGAQLLVNVTNDAWFGHSWARYQHFQIARMRAIEARRPLIRAANDGISALVGAHGQVLAQASEFVPTVLRGTVQPRVGLPPYVRLGNYLIVVLGLLGAGYCAGRRVWQIVRTRRVAPGLSSGFPHGSE
ncbi:MAG TPA: apolipoprotein N-acyltransferase [Steroidobacteraceae bacterium]|nr:apolipoprotein N-acyltransferase [Steroidobacteraceae bacterium]